MKRPGDVSRETRRPPLELPELSADDFARRLRAVAPLPLANGQVERLAAFYRELTRWAPHLALIGRGTASEVLERHFGESLAAMPLLPPEPYCAVDVGSGAGFPGLVLAALSPEGSAWTLLEPRQRKWAFLRAVRRSARLPVDCVNARLEDSQEVLPKTIHRVTVRALKLSPGAWEVLLPRLAASARVLLWSGRASPKLPVELRVTAEHRLEGREEGRILVAERRE